MPKSKLRRKLRIDIEATSPANVIILLNRLTNSILANYSVDNVGSDLRDTYGVNSKDIDMGNNFLTSCLID